MEVVCSVVIIFTTEVKVGVIGPIFVTGMPRSGTTLLASILNAHSQVAVSPETDYFTLVWKPLARHDGFRHWEKVEEVLRAFFKVPDVKLLDLPFEQLLGGYRDHWKAGRLDHRVILTELLSLYAEQRGKTIWAEKTPDHFMYIPIIKWLFPEARIVAIVRDPRDVHASLAKLPWNRGNALNHALQWRGYQSLARQFRARYDGSFVDVRFEDLISNPTGTVRALCDRLDLEFESSMIERHGEELIFDPKAEPWKQEVSQSINPNNHGKWKKTLTPAEVALFSRVCGKYLKAWDYEVPDPDSAPGPMVRDLEWRSVAWWVRTNWRVKHGRDPWLGRPMGEMEETKGR